MLGVFYKRESKSIKLHKCHLSTRQVSLCLHIYSLRVAPRWKILVCCPVIESANHHRKQVADESAGAYLSTVEPPARKFASSRQFLRYFFFPPTMALKRRDRSQAFGKQWTDIARTSKKEKQSRPRKTVIARKRTRHNNWLTIAKSP